MAIGVKVDPKVIAAGTVVAVHERTAFVSDEDRARGVVGAVDRHDVLLSQGDGGQLLVRFRVRDGIAVPNPGEYVAIESRVSEGSMSRDGQEIQFVSLVALGPAYNALDAIHSGLNAAKAKG